jgi:hypothetical protein
VIQVQWNAVAQNVGGGMADCVLAIAHYVTRHDHKLSERMVCFL